MWMDGLGKLKNPVNSSGIEIATFRLLAQCLSQLRYGMLQTKEHVWNQKQVFYFCLKIFVRNIFRSDKHSARCSQESV
jgi:hypothetical protein